MANTYTPITSTTLNTSTTLVTFSSIPQIYNDLILKISARSTDNVNPQNSIRLWINGLTSNIYSFTRLTSDGSTLSSYVTPANGNELYFAYGISGSSATSNTFGIGEIYIPNYGSLQNKPMSSFNISENNNITGYVGITSGLSRVTSAINMIEVGLIPTQSFVSGSTFHLYGISNT